MRFCKILVDTSEDLSEIMIFDAVLVKHLCSLYVVRTTPDSEDLPGQQTMCFWLIRMCLITDSFHEAPLSYRSRFVSV